jgi:hypothetical protein
LARFVPQAKRSIPIPTLGVNWKIQLGEEEFRRWKHSQGKHLLLFDGASKGNPRVAGVGGSFLIPKGNQEITFEWGLGRASNNQAEALALFQGLKLLLMQVISKV